MAFATKVPQVCLQATCNTIASRHKGSARRLPGRLRPFCKIKILQIFFSKSYLKSGEIISMLYIEPQPPDVSCTVTCASFNDCSSFYCIFYSAIAYYENYLGPKSACRLLKGTDAPQLLPCNKAQKPEVKWLLCRNDFVEQFSILSNSKKTTRC